jgi:hypothetical protein
MRQVGAEDMFEVAAADDEQVVEALAADGADPPFGDRVRVCPILCVGVV